MNENTPEPAIAIVRGSTKRQVNTIPTLERIVRGYAEVKSFDMQCVFKDPCTSAEKIPFFKREVVAKALDYCRERGVRHIIIANIDDGFRDVADCREAVRILTFGEDSDDLFTVDVAGITGMAIHIVENGIDSRNKECLLILAIRAACAAEATRKRSDRHKESFKAIKPTGQRCGSVPYGWDAVKSTRVSKTGRQADDLVPNVVEQTILRFIKTARETMSANAIARHLNSQSIKAKNGGKWFGASVDSVLKHARFGEKHKGSTQATPKGEDNEATQKMPTPEPVQREITTPAYAQLHCPACSHALRLTLPLQGRLWNCPNCKTRFTVAFDHAGHMAIHIKLPTNDASFDRPWHEVLAVATNASVAQIKAAYLALIKKSHPDKVASMSDEFTRLANQKAKEINRAYDEALTKRANR